jgi:hypothetical protein
MKHSLNEKEKLFLEGLVEDAEKRAGSQLFLAVIERCDSYP